MSEDWSSWWADTERRVVYQAIDVAGGWARVHEIVVDVDRLTACTEDGAADAVDEGLDQPERR